MSERSNELVGGARRRATVPPCIDATRLTLTRLLVVGRGVRCRPHAVGSGYAPVPWVGHYGCHDTLGHGQHRSHRCRSAQTSLGALRRVAAVHRCYPPHAYPPTLVVRRRVRLYYTWSLRVRVCRSVLCLCRRLRRVASEMQSLFNRRQGGSLEDKSQSPTSAIGRAAIGRDQCIVKRMVVFDA